ncbi:acetyl-CoA carboxylase biotin carboxyl carrier protein [Variovorax sp. J31P179]|uniref:acetyl-CoA carboxylase biotin carboxyl carrier protein n=1 Tax=Variovorax sp. J31P179 TaxID=3053508 RepID=UPI00257758BA|nr:acetyl-CoA carboxylase biotin carboxyl carrier protein [Variovorax sp. J31P179]MDM0085446.1 acetyl-CoA carboxylase biotin carboxyl carrier protein [Variovorax sp. J31P179]
MPLSHTDVRRILEILDSAAHLESLDVTVGDFELHARKPGASSTRVERVPQATASRLAESTQASEAPAGASSAAAPELLTEVPEGLVAVRSPMVGSFYLRPSPDQPPFVAVGSTVQADDTVCLVEVMKMFNTVKAGVTGTVERIVIENGKPVQHDQIVMLIKPTQGA